MANLLTGLISISMRIWVKKRGRTSRTPFPTPSIRTSKDAL
jgi:hypothetical protein